MSNQVTVRMYNVGFGDCFLLEFPKASESPPFRVLVDCGAHTSGYPRQGWKPEHTVDQIIEDIGAADPHLDVVVATHRHQDHVSGFRAAAWKQVHVGEVWLPWTEHPTDDDAIAIRNRQSRLALGLDSAFQRLELVNRYAGAAAGELEALRSMVKNSLTNAKAMSTLHSGFKGKPRRQFLSADEVPTITPADCPGLTIHVLGPSRDSEVIRDMDPPSGQSYLRFAEPTVGEFVTASMQQWTKGEPSSPAQGHKPFARQYTFDPIEYETPDAEGKTVGPVLDPAIKDAAASIMNEDDLSVAVALSKAVNGTSLMLMFEFGNAFLLFPGDAQWGTWNAAMTNPETRSLLARTTFYKVGHHGSHNATPTDFLEGVMEKTDRMWAAATSVREIAFWPEIPRGPLIDQLKERSERVVRSDNPGASRNSVQVRPGIGVDFKVPCE